MQNLTFKKNDIEKLLLNLDQNPYSQKNKDFKYCVSLIYELIEEEFSDTFSSNNPILRTTKIDFDFDGKNANIFISPPYDFEYYLKSRGSLYRLRAEYKGDKYGYNIGLDLFFEYFTGLDENLDVSESSEDYQFFYTLCRFVKKTIEKLNFIPTVKFYPDKFSIIYEPYLKNEDYLACYKKVLENKFLDMETTRKLIDKYLNYLIFKFLGIKNHKFKDIKSAPYFTKNIANKLMLKQTNLGLDIQTWLDEMALGTYTIVPVFNIQKADDEKFLMVISAKNIETGETIELEELDDFQKTLIEKQINWATKYIEDLEDVTLELDLAGVYKLITQISYYLSQAGMEVNLPEGMNNIIVPRASINAKLKQKRALEEGEVVDFTKNTTISLDEIMDFSIEVALGEDKISVEEFRKLAENSQGVIKYKDKFILIDKEETDKLLEKLKKTPNLKMSKMKLLHAALSGKLDEYDFDYDMAFAKVISDFTKVEDIELPKNLQGTLRPYQEVGYRWLYTNVKKGFGCCIADDMGLGKTVQVISLILKLKEENKLKTPALVVCPTTLLGNWNRELKTFAPSLNAKIYHGLDRVFDINCDVILTTYAILRIDSEEFKKHNWDLMIIDEAQNIKNTTTSQTQAVKAIKADMKIAMTGTPVENKLSELWSIFDFINKGYLGSIVDFGKNYSIPIERFKETARGEKLKLAISPFMMRRLKTDKSIISDLPDKIVLDEFCYLTKAQATLYEKVLSQSMSEISAAGGGINRRGAIFKLITSLKQVCNHPYHYLKSGDMSINASGKSEKLVSILDNIIENNEKALIFTQYKQMGEILEPMLASQYNIQPLFFHGSLNVKQREEMLEQFKNNEDKKIMILSLKAGGLGLNLTSATNVIHYDLWWNPAVEDQATDRTYRIGQDKNVMVHRFITLSTFEEKIDAIIKNKRELAQTAVFEGEKIITELSDEEIYEIFSLA
ncbi:DEAD/DEAH box helicase [bacterium]|nr:DEAD/DEAH box helicase [bacterium]